MITDQIKFKLFYQHILADRLHSQVNCTRKHWENLYKFIKTSRCGSQFEINENLIVKYFDEFDDNNRIKYKLFDQYFLNFIIFVSFLGLCHICTFLTFLVYWHF